MPVPLPELLFGSLVDRWNAFSPVTVSPDMRRFAAELIAISRYRLTSRAVTQKAGGTRMGGVGEVTYRALGGDRYWWRVMHMLADFAGYGGAGIQTTTGMGQCRRIR
jgi:CRISPR-associated endoribonuclease Cas6